MKKIIKKQDLLKVKNVVAISYMFEEDDQGNVVSTDIVVVTKEEKMYKIALSNSKDGIKEQDVINLYEPLYLFCLDRKRVNRYLNNEWKQISLGDNNELFVKITYYDKVKNDLITFDKPDRKSFKSLNSLNSMLNVLNPSRAYSYTY